MKSSSTCLFIIVFFSMVNAQILKVNVSAQVASNSIELAKSNAISSTGYGLEGSYLLKLDQNSDISFGLSYMAFDSPLNNDDVTFVPLSAGFNFNMGAGGFLPYLGLKASMVFIDYDTLNVSSANTSAVTENVLELAPYAGLKVPLTSKIYWDINLQMNFIFNKYKGNNYFTLSSGVGFRLF